MAIKDQIIELVTPALQEQSFYLEDIHIVTPGNHRIVTCIVDGDLALNLDQVTSASRIISEMLDAAAFMGESPFTLEVTSRGVDRPRGLLRRRREQRARGELVGPVSRQEAAARDRPTSRRGRHRDTAGSSAAAPDPASAGGPGHTAADRTDPDTIQRRYRACRKGPSGWRPSGPRGAADRRNSG